MSFRLSVMAAAGIALAAVLAAAAPAAATQGSVPPEVAQFATAPDGLILGLDDFFGLGADGEGIDFDDSTEVGTVGRVFTFAQGWLEGRTTETPVALANEWIVPISVGGEPVGVAIIWINPSTVRPQLADFLPDPAFASALAEVAEEAWLVHDEARDAWFAFVAPTLTSLVTGTSGVAGDVALTAYQRDVTRAEESTSASDEGTSLSAALSVGTIVAGSLIVVLVLLIPVVRRRRAGVGDDEQVGDGPDA
jgi:hypothetical protein